MALSSSTQAFINFYAREGYYKHIQLCCDQALARGDDPVFRFWKAFGILQESSFCRGDEGETDSKLLLNLFPLSSFRHPLSCSPIFFFFALLFLSNQ